jgi:spectinomycin phosphotransferase
MGGEGSTRAPHQKPDLPDEALLSRLRDAYGLRPREIAFLPLGADPHIAVYRVWTEDGGAYFLKLRRGGPDETSVVVPGVLSDQGVGQVIPPVPATAGRLWTTCEGFALVLYPFVEGEDGYAVPLSDAQWVELGAAVRGIHGAQLPPPVGRRIPRETFTPGWREALGGFLARAGSERFEDHVAAGLAALLWAERERISGALDRAERLGAALRAGQRPAVLCHGDLHAGNVLLARSGALHLIDWDTLVYAPRERDFEQIGGTWGGERERGLFYEGYGAIEVDQTALAYYRYWRIMEDLVVACEQVLATGEGGVNRERELEIVRQSLRPGRALDVATRLDRG